jgi:hypothetical protein
MMSADAIIMGQIVKYATSENGGVVDFTTAIIPKLPMIVFMVVAKKCIENSGDFFYSSWESFKSLMKRLFYTQTRIYDHQKPDSKNYHLNNVYDKQMYSFANQYFPIEKTVIDKELVVSHIGWLPYHKALLDTCEKEASVLFDSYLDASSQQKIIYKKLVLKEGLLKYEPSESSQLYPSKNYLKLVDIIRDHFDVSNRIKSFSVIGASINGIPGLGKTKFADFAVNNKLAGTILKVDMTSMLKYSFTRVLHVMYHSIAIVTDTIFVIDEIDKYLDYRMNIEYEDKLLELKNQAKEGVVELNKKEFVSQMKNTFLYDILSILERDGLSHSVVVIFCSNNFQSIFEGLDMTHHYSTFTRFMPVEFEMCDHVEIIEYLLHYNKIFEGTKFWLDLDRKTMEKTLRKDVCVTHRVLHHTSIKANYHAWKIINALNENKSMPDIPKLNNTEESNSTKVMCVSKRAMENQQSDGFERDENSENGDLSSDEESDSDAHFLEDVQEEVESFVDQELVKSKGNILKGKPMYELFKDWCQSHHGYVGYRAIHSCFMEALDTHGIETSFIEDEVIGYAYKNFQKSKDPLEHELIWKERYEVSELPANFTEIINTTTEYLNEVEKFPSCSHERILMVTKLLDHMAEERYLICSNKLFKKTFIEKINIFYDDIETRELLFPKLKSSTKEFIYALTGIKC